MKERFGFVMFNESFIVMERSPSDVKEALDVLTAIVKGRGDADLLLKVGEIKGAYAVYERTNDTSILENIIIDIVLLFKKVVSPVAPVKPPKTTVSPFGEYRTDLIYYNSADTEEEKISTDELIENFLNKMAAEKKSFSSNTRTSYASSLRKIFKKMKINNVLKCSVPGLAREIESHIKNHPEYNHNIKSAASGIVKYMLDLEQ